jgi:uroporphyrinogen-III decarboxylase
MTKVSVSRFKKAMRGKVTLFGGVPSVALLEGSMSDAEFEKFMMQTFREIAPGDRFILGVADTTPPDAKFERLKRLTEMVRERGRIPMAG